MARWHNLGRTRVVEMRTPVGHHAIAAVWTVASSTVSAPYDTECHLRGGACSSRRQNGFWERACRWRSACAAGDIRFYPPWPRSPCRRWIMTRFFGRRTSLVAIFPIQFDAISLPRCGVDIKIARSISRLSLKMRTLASNALSFSERGVCACGVAEDFAPDRILTAVRNHHAGEEPTHAVTDHHDLFVIGKSLVEPIRSWRKSAAE